MRRKIYSTKQIQAADNIKGLQDRADYLRSLLADPELDEDTRIDLGIELAQCEDDLRFAWAEDERDYLDALERQEFEPDGSLAGYPLDFATSIKAAKDSHVSTCSFDFINDGLYDNQELASKIEEAFVDAGVTPLAVDFHSVDYSDYAPYADRTVSQCGVDFRWSGNYYEDAIEEEVALVLDWIGYELVGIDFYSARDDVYSSTQVKASRDIDEKIRAYLADWAKDDAKKGKPVESFREFKRLMKEDELEADETRYDYYMKCYNNAMQSKKK